MLIDIEILKLNYIYIYVYRCRYDCRLSETGLHDCVDLARKLKFFGGNGSGAIPLIIGNDEIIQRDSATSAGEDEPHEDGHSNRIGPISSQGRSMLRRRRQFDAQGELSCIVCLFFMGKRKEKK